MKLALIIHSLKGGGAERVMTTLANGWAERGAAVYLLTLSGKEPDEFELDSRVTRIELNLLGESRHFVQALGNNLRRIHRLRRELRRIEPDIALSFTTTLNAITVLAAFGTGVPVVVSERISVADHPASGVWRMLCAITYRRAAAVVMQTEEGARWLQTRLSVPVAVISNPLPNSPTGLGRSCADSQKNAAGGGFTLLAMGRLEHQKGFDMLLSAFAQVAPRYPQWNLTILGEGAMRVRLEEQVEKLGLVGRVLLPGFRRNSVENFLAADAFVLSSRYEGMPNSLMEAMASGIPCVSFDCRTGPADLIDDGVNGLLVPPGDVEALAHELGRVMEDPLLRSRLSLEARRICERFGLEKVLGDWEYLFREIEQAREQGQRSRTAEGTGSRGWR